MKFGEPFLLLLLLLIPLLSILFIWSSKQKRRELEKFFSRSHAPRGNVVTTQSVGTSAVIKGMMEEGKGEKISFMLVLTGVSFLILALAQPQIGSKTETMKRAGADVIFLIDASSSMSAEDVKPNRFKKAKEDVSKFLDKFEGDRVGLVAFAHVPVLISPLTTDYMALKEFLNTVDADLFHEGGTSVEMALNFCIPIFQQRTVGQGFSLAKVIILIGDGEDSESNIESAGKIAAQNGIKVYTIGIGTKNGAPIPVFAEDGSFVGYKEDRSGNKILTRLEEATLRKVSGLTDGKYYSMTGKEIKSIVSDLRRMKKAQLGEKVSDVYVDRFQYFLLTAIFLIFIGRYIK